MHSKLEEAARAVGFHKNDGTLLIISEPAETTFAIRAALRTWTSKFPRLRAPLSASEESEGPGLYEEE